jgi:hypothetical protein
MIILINPNPEPENRIIRPPWRDVRLFAIDRLERRNLRSHLFVWSTDNIIVDSSTTNSKVVAQNERTIIFGRQISHPVDSTTCSPSPCIL